MYNYLTQFISHLIQMWSNPNSLSTNQSNSKMDKYSDSEIPKQESVKMQFQHDEQFGEQSFCKQPSSKSHVLSQLPPGNNIPFY
jgi:hypothetical protein